MRNKIKKFSKGDFRTECPEVRLPGDSYPHDDWRRGSLQGSFTIENQKRGTGIRGIVIPLLFVFSA